MAVLDQCPRGLLSSQRWKQLGACVAGCPNSSYILACSYSYPPARVSLCVCVCIHAEVNVEMSFSVSLCFIFETESLNLELSVSLRLAGPWAPGIRFPFPSIAGIVNACHWRSELSFSFLRGSTWLTKPSPPPFLFPHWFDEGNLHVVTVFHFVIIFGQILTAVFNW